MAKGKIKLILDPKWYCPICGHNKIKGNSRQVSEDCCEMWFECEKCGYDPAGICDRVETIWGWEDELETFALEIYRDCHPAGRKMYHDAFIALQAAAANERETI